MLRVREVDERGEKGRRGEKKKKKKKTRFCFVSFFSCCTRVLRGMHSNVISCCNTRVRRGSHSGAFERGFSKNAVILGLVYV